MRFPISGISLFLMCGHIIFKRTDAFSPHHYGNQQQLHMSSEADRNIVPAQNIIGSQQQPHRLSEGDANKISGKKKVVVRRHLYRFSPKQPYASSKIKYAIEERQHYSIGEDNMLLPLGDKSVIFRGEEVRTGEDRGVVRVGPALHTIQGLKDEKDSAGRGGSVLESCYAMALYCMENPEIISGKGLEVGSGLGFGGILSAIGAGIASGAYGKVLEDGQKQAPLPNSLSKIVLTESKKELLDACAENLATSMFPPENLNLGFLDWNDKVPSGLKDEFNFILGCDSVKDFSEVDGLAKIVGNGLKSGSSYVHVGPQYRESMKDLKVKLGRGYGMRTLLENIALERFELTPFRVEVEDIEKSSRGNEKESHKYIEYRNKDVSTFSVLLSHHENGNFDSFDEDSVFIYKIESRRLDAGHALSLIADQDLSLADRISRLELLTFADFAYESISEATSLSIAILSLIAASPIASAPKSNGSYQTNGSYQANGSNRANGSYQTNGANGSYQTNGANGSYQTNGGYQANGGHQANDSWSQSPQPYYAKSPQVNSYSQSPKANDSWSQPDQVESYSQSPQANDSWSQPDQVDSYPQSPQQPQSVQPNAYSQSPQQPQPIQPTSYPQSSQQPQPIQPNSYPQSPQQSQPIQPNSYPQSQQPQTPSQQPWSPSDPGQNW